ncbi:MAG: acyl carrier protein [Selenomonadaceae bacterium]|nr:acyl carrier protein [Selenomonadaceae bacterium]MBR1579130.1 acyl carrier protein [Selenomonadaceae bacterium]
MSTERRCSGLSTFDKVKEIVVDQLQQDADNVTPNSTFVDDLGADSLDIVELIMRFEDEFGIEIPDEKAEKIKTVSDVVKYIDGNANED